MMEAAGPSSPFDFESIQMGPGSNGDFNLSEYVTSPPDQHTTDDFMAAFSLDGVHENGTSSTSSPPFNHHHPSPSTDYPPMSIAQLQQLHSQISQQSSPSGGPPSPSVHLAGPQHPPSESDLQSILDGLMTTNSPRTQQGLVDAGNMDLGSLMGQLAGMANNGGGGALQQQQQEGPSAFASPSPQPPQLQQAQGESTATALQRLQQLQQLQQYQSQFIQQQLDQLTRQAAEQAQKNQQQQQQQQQGQQLHFQPQPQPQQHSNQHLQSQQQQLQQQHANHFRSHSIDQSNSNLSMHQGLPTPAHSSELYATMHQEMVSPIHLPGGAAGRYRDSNEYDLDGNLLFTPLMSPAMSQSNQTTPGSAFQPINSLTHTPSADFFSPLTSPALGPVFHSSDYNRVSNSSHHQSQNQNNHSHNPPSMSPHLLAQNSSMSMSPHLLAQQSGMMAPGSPAAQKRSTSSSGKSRSSRGTGSSTAGGAGGPEGKHAKARPSPLMKPIASSSSRRRKDSMGGSMPSPRLPLMSPQLPMDGIGEMEISESSQQSSSSNNYFPQPSPSSYGQHNHLIPSAIPANIDQGSSGSNSSPSPVDLASLQMPPPPVPTAQQRRLSASSNYSNGSGASSMVSSIAPQTPATFLNLSRTGHSGSANSSSSSSTTAMNSTPVNPSPLSSPFISATDPSTYGNGNGYSHRPSSSDGPNGGGAAKVAPQASSSSSSNPSRGVSNTYKPPFIAPIGKGKTPGAAPKGAKKAKASDRSKPPLPTKPEPASSTSTNKPPEVRKTSHREAEQRRRDSLKAGFDELRVLLPPINVEAFDPDTGEPIAGASMPRLPARSPLIPDDNPNRGVSKVALLRCSNKHIGLLNGRIERRDALIERLRREVVELRGRAGVGAEEGLVSAEGEGEEWEDVLEVDVDLVEREDEDYDDEEEDEGEGGGEENGGLGEVLEEDEHQQEEPSSSSKKSRRPSSTSTRTKSASTRTTVPAPRMSMGRAAAAVASAKIREGEGEEEDEEAGEGMDQS
ncbi:hypothetical protein BDY24DRAFT_414929 [Mrakia frigida]|uniref:uncharacterized protein n=1 Tax=Mrakia frigida TaxID=29902 RepID=UPI003FCBF737